MPVLLGCDRLHPAEHLQKNSDKYNREQHPDHFIPADAAREVDFGEGKKSIYAFKGTEIPVRKDKDLQMAVNGRSVYISALAGAVSFFRKRKSIAQIPPAIMKPSKETTPPVAKREPETKNNITQIPMII